MSAISNERSQYVDVAGKPLLGGKVYIGIKGLNPRDNPEPIYSDPALTTALDNPQIINTLGMTEHQIYVLGQYSLAIDDVNDIQQQLSLVVGTEPVTGGPITVTNIQGINALTGVTSPTFSEYADKQEYRFTVIAANTAAMTLNINGVGAVDITDSLAGLVVIGQILSVFYNATNEVFDTNSTRNLASPAAIGNVTPNTGEFTSLEATSLVGQIVDTANIKSNAITLVKMADNSVDTAELVALSVETAKINNSAVTNQKVASSAIARAELKTTTVSLSGGVNAGGTTNVILTGGGYVFFPMIHATQETFVIGHGTDGASADSPRFAFRNTSASAATYDVDYRYIQA